MISKNKIAAVVLSSALVLTTAIPAFAATYNVNNVQQIQASDTFKSRVVVTVPQNSLPTSANQGGSTPDKIRFTLPTDVTFTTVPSITVDTLVGSGIANQFASATYTQVSSNGDNYVEISVYRNVTGGAIGEGQLVVDFPAIATSGLSGGDVKIKAEAQAGSVFTNADITVATVGTGSVNVTIDDVKTITSGAASANKVSTLRLKEDRASAFKGNDSVKIKLPAGFKWVVSSATAKVVWGNAAATSAGIVTTDADRTLSVNAIEPSVGAVASYLTFDNLFIDVDESVAKKGDVVATISGNSTVTPSTITVAKYGELSSSISVYGDVPTIPAGKRFDTISQIGSFKIEEESKGSLLPGRTITLTLPEGARWNYSSVTTPDKGFNISGDSKDGGITLNTSSGSAWTVVDASDAGRILKGSFNITGGSSTTEAKLIFEKAQVSTAADFSGDLTVEVAGTQGLTGKLVLAKVVPSVKVSVAEKKPVTLGLGSQAIGDIEITELTKEALNKDTSNFATLVTPDAIDDQVTNKTVNVQLPLGVFFAGTPTVAVTAGDVEIEQSSVTVNQLGEDGSQGSLRFSVKASSATPSTIKISNVQLTADRTVPEGDIVVKVRGSAINKSRFSGRGTAASAVVGTLVTPASTDVKADAAFKIGDTKYTVNGVEKTADVAPYIKDGRTFLPVRYAAEALGVSSDNIIFDAASGTVTLIKGSVVAQVTVGSNKLVINGATITMDVVAEVSSDRVFLPLRYIAQALGAAVAFDEATQTVTLK